MTTYASGPRAVGMLVVAVAVWAATACQGGDVREPSPRSSPRSSPAVIELLAVSEVDLPTSVVSEENGRARLVSALPDGPDAATVAAVDLAERLLIVAAYDACTHENPRLQWRGADRLTPVYDETGVNCLLPIPAVAIFALERAGLPERVTYGGDQPSDSDIVINQES